MQSRHCTSCSSLSQAEASAATATMLCYYINVTITALKLCCCCCYCNVCSNKVWLQPLQLCWAGAVAAKLRQLYVARDYLTWCRLFTLLKIFIILVQVLLMVDASFGFEMETFEFLNIAQAHGFPKIMGVLTHLDGMKNNKTLTKTKKKLKHRFWKEVYQVILFFTCSKTFQLIR